VVDAPTDSITFNVGAGDTSYHGDMTYFNAGTIHLKLTDTAGKTVYDSGDVTQSEDD
jgi:hypothetical protein